MTQDPSALMDGGSAASDLPVPDVAAAAIRAAYDAHPYKGKAFWFTHPDHLRVLGHLHGVPAAPASTARVLALGCGDGGNIIPMAARLPGARFVGVDLSPAHMAAARARSVNLGLTNMTWRCADLTALDPAELGEFDYVIAHGLLSWVPPAVVPAIWELLGGVLAPGGLAMVSYNTFPGWHDFGAVSQLMKFHTSGVTSDADKIAQARAIARWFLVRGAKQHDGMRDGLNSRLLKDITATSDTLIRHDYLSEYRQAFWFEEVAAAADSVGLRFMANARPGHLRAASFEPEVVEMLRGVSDPIRRQQYMDFMRNTRFRTSVFCRAAHPVQEDADLGLFALLQVTSRVGGDLAPPEEITDIDVELETKGATVQIEGAALKICLAVLQTRAPRAMSLAELADAAAPYLRAEGLVDEGLGAAAAHAWTLKLFTRELARLYFGQVVIFAFEPPELRGRDQDWGSDEAAAPLADPYCRSLAQMQPQPPGELANPWHWMVSISQGAWRMLPLLNGSNSVSDLAEADERALAHLNELGRAGLILS